MKKVSFFYLRNMKTCFCFYIRLFHINTGYRLDMKYYKRIFQGKLTELKNISSCCATTFSFISSKFVIRQYTIKQQVFRFWSLHFYFREIPSNKIAQLSRGFSLSESIAT
jgi:hypothetical protein